MRRSVWCPNHGNQGVLAQPVGLVVQIIVASPFLAPFSYTANPLINRQICPDIIIMAWVSVCWQTSRVFIVYTNMRTLYPDKDNVKDVPAQGQDHDSSSFR